MTIQLTLEQVKSLIKKDYTIASETRTGNNLGTMLKLTNGCIDFAFASRRNGKAI